MSATSHDADFTVYAIPGSPYARAALATLEEKGAGYRIAAVAPAELKSDEHRRRHPFGRVPVLEHNGFRVYETQAILRYLDRVLPEPPLTPAAVQGSARMDQMMNVNDCYLFQGVANVIAFQRVVGPRLFGLTPDETAIAAAMPRAAAVFAELASALGTQHYMAGDALSLADLLIAPQLDFMILTPEWEQLVGPYPALRIWMARMQDRASLKTTTWEEVARKAQVH